MNLSQVFPVIIGLATLVNGIIPTMAASRIPITCAKLTAIDGDSIKCDGVNMRDMGDGAPFVSGYDTPETRKAKCEAEKSLGLIARKRMAQLLTTPGLVIYDSGVTDGRYQRPLVWIMLPDGRSVGSVMIAEGLAKVWTPDYIPEWCLTAS